MLNYPPTKTTPWNHQGTAWDKSQNFMAYYLAMDMGAGKSHSAIAYMLGFDCTANLIICPKAVINVWPKQFDIHSSVTHAMYLGNNNRSVEKKAAEIQDFIKRSKAKNLPYTIVLNYESFWRPPLGPIYNKFKLIHPGLLKSLEWDLMILDESHKIKSPGSKVSWGAMRIGQSAERRLCLSGTPMPHSVGDIYAQFRFLDTKIFGSSYANFKAEYCKMGGYQGQQIVGVQDPKKLGRKFFSRAYRVKTEDVVQLPPSRHQEIPCILSPKAMKIYKELEKDFVTWVDQEEVSVDNALTRMLRLSQMACGFYQDGVDNKVHLIDPTKIETVIDQVYNLKHDEPAVIVCKFRPEIELIRQEIEKRNQKADQDKIRRIGELSGKADDLLEWQNGLRDILICQIQSGNAGVDFTRGAYMFISSTGFPAGDYMQLLARILRPGQKRPVMYYHFHSQNTIDQKIFQSIQKRISDVKKVTDAPSGSIGGGVTMSSIQKDILNDAVSDIRNRLGIPQRETVPA